MENPVPTRLIMLGAALETSGSVAALVQAYRAGDLFRRWPADYVATYGSDGLLGEARRTLRAARELAPLLAGHRAVAHVHLSVRSGLARQAVFGALAAATRARLVLQLHGGGFERFHESAGAVLRAAIERALSGAAWVLVPCESLAAWVRGVSRDANVLCVPPAILPAPPAAEGPRPHVVLFLGRMSAERGTLDLVEAVAKVRATIPDVRLVCAGPGDRAGVARHAARLGIAPAVTVTGTVGPSGKRALLEAAALLALPAYDEGLPVGMLEAMAAGLPVIATPVGGIPEVVADGTSGLLAAPGDKAGLARALAKLLSDPALAHRMGAAARETVRRRFSPQRSLATLEGVYGSLGLDGAPHAAPGREAPMRRAA